MAHSDSTTFTETFTSAANTTGQSDTVMTVPAGPAFKIRRVDIAIESGAGSNVGVQVFSGDQPIAPQDNQMDIAGERVELPTDVVLSPGDEVEARHDNNSTTAFDVTVIVVGEEHTG